MAGKKSRGWCFTLNNPSGGAELYKSIDCLYIVIGDETGESGTHHHQGYIYFKNARAFDGIKKILPAGAHIEAANGNAAQNRTYCTKEKILLEIGECPAQGKRKDIETVRSMIQEGCSMRAIVDSVNSFQAIRGAELLLKYQEAARDWVPEVYWFWGPTGTGKTRTAFDLCAEPWVSGRNLKWWEGYDAHTDVIIDDFRGDFCTFHELLRILDRYPYRVEVKGGSRQLLAKRIFITCPVGPQAAYPGCGEKINQLLRRITEIREFPAGGTNVPAQKSGGNTTPPTDLDIDDVLDELCNAL